MRGLKKKVLPEFFDLIEMGVKSFEVRLADFNCMPGDILVLKEWEPQTQEFTGRVIERKVMYVFKMQEAAKYGLQVIGFLRLNTKA